MKRRIIWLLLVAVLAAACGDDDTTTAGSTTSTTADAGADSEAGSDGDEADGDDSDAEDGRDSHEATGEFASWCPEYEDYVNAQSDEELIAAAAALEEALGTDAPPGLIGVLLDVQDGLDVDDSNIHGYVGPTCTDDDETDRAAAEIGALCEQYSILVNTEGRSVEIEAAAELERLLGDDAPPGVIAALQTIQGPRPEDADWDALDGYVGPICDDEFANEGEGRDPDALEADEVCLGLHDAWADDDIAATGRFGPQEPIDELFSRTFTPPANAAIGGASPDCFYNNVDEVAEVQMLGDGHVGWNVVEVIWHDSEAFFADADLSSRFEAGTGGV